ncbi:MAG TPA: hypothetical protein VKZ48_01145 [Burkholderiales bacterium]|nr:hypothetical protein [Burkholderiales bacterium]
MTPASFAIVEILIWGLIATLAMGAILFASQNFGWSRLDLPFLLGTVFTGERHAANVLGFTLTILVGWFIAFFYYLFFAAFGEANWWLGAAAGFVHGLLVLTALLPLMPYIHPRVASEYDGPSLRRRLEPPGFLGLHYGYRTPVVTLIAQTVYGAVLGAGFELVF